MFSVVHQTDIFRICGIETTFELGGNNLARNSAELRSHLAPSPLVPPFSPVFKKRRNGSERSVVETVVFWGC